LVIVSIYWTIVWLKVGGKKPGLTPGFNGFAWIRELFPKRFAFLPTVRNDYIEEEGPKAIVPAVRKVRRQQAVPQIESNDMNFPTLGARDDANLDPEELKKMSKIQKEHRALIFGGQGKKSNIVVTKVKIIF